MGLAHSRNRTTMNGQPINPSDSTPTSQEPLGIVYPSLSHQFVELDDATDSNPELVLGPANGTAIIVMSKNHTDRLSRTLQFWPESGVETILLDDSTTEGQRRQSRKLARQFGVDYHGREAQTALLGSAGNPPLHGFVSPLGTEGWTLGRCRNYALLLGLGRGYQRTLLVDDDIVPFTPDIARKSLALLTRFDLVGARTEGYPDDSVVGHLARIAGTTQYDFVTGQYLAVRSVPREAYFPEIYNEDLIFLLLQIPRAATARYGKVVQLTPRNPKLNPLLATEQEPGETHVEGLIHFVNSEGGGAITSASFWNEIIDFRRRCIEELLNRKQISTDRNMVCLLKRVLRVHKGKRGAEYARFYRRYFNSQQDWMELQSRFVGIG